jgi:hypothetical protein
MKRHALLMVVVALALLAIAPMAYGAGAVTDGYGGKGGGVLGAVNSGGGNGTPPAQVAATSNGSLPFTGLDIGLLALGGVVLVAVGVGLRRVARPLS